MKNVLIQRVAFRAFSALAATIAFAIAAPSAYAAATTPPEGVELTDLTSPSGTVTTTTTGDWVKPAKNAFDNGTAHNNDDRSIHSGTSVDWIYTFDAKTKVNAYKVYCPSTTPYNYDKRMPKTWTFEAKNAEDATWIVLDTQSSETGWSGLESRYYEFTNNTAYDSYRFAVTADNGGDGYIQIDELEFFYVNTDAPKLGSTSLVRTGVATYSLTAEEDVNAADISYILSDGETVSTNGTQAVAEGDTETWTIAGLTANKTYQVSVLAANNSGTDEKVAGTLYTGELVLGATTDASENGLVAGTVAVSRNSNDPFPLVVNYTVSSSADGAVEGKTWAAPTTVTIPAGETTGYLLVTPLLDSSVTENIEVTVTLAAGNYEMPTTSAKTLQIINLVAPVGYNTWVATADGLASVDSNWSAGHAPLATEQVLFDGRFSTANCEWDSAASATVASWMQTNGYTGTVTFKTTFPEADAAFTAFTITGDATLCSGKWTHPAATAATEALAHNYYRLKVSIGGTLTICSGASISVSAKGTWAKSSGGGGIGGSYGGQGNWGTAFGSLLEPSALGESASTTGNSANLAPAFGGGAVWLEVTGKTVLDGKILSDGIGVAGEWADYSWGSGGSIYLSTASLAGTGTMSASGDAGGGSKCKNAGSGGRISILLTSAAEMSFPSENITAYGSSSYSCVAGTGTIVVRTTQKTNGTLYLRDRSDKYGQFKYRPRPALTTPIPAGQTWILDSIVFGKNAILRVPTGTTLDLRGGLASVSSTSTALDDTGLLVDGGTLLLPDAAAHTVSGNWIFEPTDFALTGDLVVTNGAGVGTLLLYSDTSNNVRTCGLSVLGDMHVASGAYLRAVRGGYIATGAATVGGTTPSCHGGQSAGGTANCAYDSFFHPRHPGAFGNDNGLVTVGGGAIRLAVGGTLTLDGTATATPPYPERRSGAAGSIDITAARLEGAGRIEANGNSRNYTKDASGYGSGGGRIAVRLTGAGETISDAWLAKINAKGFYSSNMTAEYSSSAGSIYLQNAAQAEGTGTIIIRNTGDTANNVAFTAIPSTKGGGEDDNFKKASLALEAAARVKLFENLKIASLEMASGTVFDLNGKVIFVKRAKVGGEHLMPGTYTPAKLSGFLIDSASGGELVVTGGGFSISVR
ncbi:MAG: hypothetical protein K6G94_04670 [Kiritimatiellae bacterium]|nr:hypothetical protein [Kiritimatiellia bacterium]